MNYDLEHLKARYSMLAEEDDFSYSRLWLNDDGESKHGLDDKGRPPTYKQCPIKLKVDDAEPGPNGGFKIKGYGSTIDLDLEDDIVLPTAFTSSLEAFKAKGIMLFMHDWWAAAVGKWHSAIIDARGLFLEGEVLPTTQGKDLIILIKAKVLDGLSIGFRTIEDTYNYDTEIRTIADLELLEVSLCHYGMNPRAIFEAAKSMHLKSITNRSQPGPEKRKGNNRMGAISPETIKKVDAMTKGFDPANGTIENRLTGLKESVDKMAVAFKAVKEKADQAADPDSLVTDDEFKAFVKRQEGELTVLSEKVQAIGLAKKEQDVVKYPVKDWRALLTNKVFLRDDAGKALPEQYQTAFKFFNLPIDYDKTEDGQLIKACRDLNDACIIIDSHQRGGKARGYQGMHQLECFKVLQEVVEYLEGKAGFGSDGPLTKAMSAGVAGVGAEWIPSLLSAEMDTLFRITPTIVNFIRPAWQMPSDTAKWPIMTGAAVSYLADEAQTNNPRVLTKTNLATGSVTFSTRTFAAAIPVSKQMLEDTIIDLVPVIREELVTALITGEEDAIINGDNSASHFDTGLSLTSADDDVRVAFKGLRKLAVDLSNTWDSQSVTLGDGTTAFAAADVRYNRQLLGVLGVDPSQCLHCISITGYFKMLAFSEVTKANEFGFASTWLTGTLPALDGVEIYISPKFNANLNASGVFDDSTTDNSALLTLHRRSFMPGEKRGVTLEFDLNIDTQQWLFVGTMRRDFQNMRPATQLPVSYAYNIDN